MKKEDLKTGMRIKTRDGRIFLFLKEVENVYNKVGSILVETSGNGWLNFKSYNDDLIIQTKHCEVFDIMSVYTADETGKAHGHILDFSKMFEIWHRDEPKKLTKTEIEKLLGYTVEIVG